jgi:hypothetical protein
MLKVPPLTKDKVSRYRSTDPNIQGLRVGDRLLALQVQRLSVFVENANAGAKTVPLLRTLQAVRVLRVRFIVQVASGANNSALQVAAGANNLHTAFDIDTADADSVKEATPTAALRDVAAETTLKAVLTAASGATVTGTVVVEYVPIEALEGDVRA